MNCGGITGGGGVVWFVSMTRYSFSDGVLRLQHWQQHVMQPQQQRKKRTRPVSRATPRMEPTTIHVMSSSDRSSAYLLSTENE